MIDPKETHDTDGVENPRMTGDSADQLYDDDTMEESSLVATRGEREGGGGLGSGGGSTDPVAS